MLIETSAKDYKHTFPCDPNPYISESFIELVKKKADRVVRLIEDKAKVSIGLVAGIKDRALISSFSSPFGGFHFRHNNILSCEIDRFLSQLISYAVFQNLAKIKITLPPTIYNHSFNTKMINSLLRNNFSTDIPEITNWIDLQLFCGEFSDRNARDNYNQSVRRNLSFHEVLEKEDMETAYNLVCKNRERLGRCIYMTFNELLAVCNLWPVDFFHVRDNVGEILASAIFYRGHPKIVQAIFWGDNEPGRLMHAMGFLAYNLWSRYKNMGFQFIDLGISTECGIPNNGLLRFKENHDSISGLRFCLTLSLTGLNGHQ